MGINWYPGHMKKATDEIRQKLRQIDLCCEIRDARIPFASANRELAALTKGKKRIIVLNKKDMADPKETERWVQALRGNGQTALAINASKERPAKRLYEEAISLLQDVGYALLTLLLRCAPEAIVSRYALSDASAEPLAVMEAIAQHTGSLLKGGEVDYTRTAQIMIDDFRKLHFGALTLERAADFAEREWNKGETI